MDEQTDVSELSDEELIQEYGKQRKLVPPDIGDDPAVRIAVSHAFIRIADELSRRFPPATAPLPPHSN